MTASFKDYVSARAHAWATGSVGATYNDTEYVRGEDTHGIRECDTAPESNDPCGRCLDAYRRKYGYPQAPKPPRVVEFEWAFHGNLWEGRENLAHELGFTPSDELLEKMGNPLYEVIVRFSLDTQTGKTTVLGAK